MKRFLKWSGFDFYVYQYRWGRKWLGGTYWNIFTIQLMIAPFWSDHHITSCQSKTLAIETY